VSPLQTVPDGQAVVLREVSQDRTRTVTGQRDQTSHDPPKTIQTVAHVIESPWQNADVATVVQSLAHSDQALQDQAKTELARRGLNASEISMASRIATGSTQAKIDLVASISESTQMDPRPWLLLLLEDHNREVRLRAVSALAALKEPWVQQQLKQRMVNEKDQTVAFRIRRVLNLR
jgi:hypothetical protein